MVPNLVQNLVQGAKSGVVQNLVQGTKFSTGNLFITLNVYGRPELEENVCKRVCFRQPNWFQTSVFFERSKRVWSFGPALPACRPVFYV
jgi:hypothetical protein